MPRERAVISLASEELIKFTGVYDGGFIGRVNIAVEGDHLLVTAPAQDAVPIYPETADTFFNLTGSFPDLKFAKDTNGKVTSFTGGNVTAKRVQ